jgi:hypothetical protein
MRTRKPEFPNRERIITKFEFTSYKHIRAWGKYLGSYEYYIKAEQARASADGAPKDAIYYSITEKRWVQFEEVADGSPAKAWVVNFLKGGK